MKFSTRAAYGLQVMILLALHYPKKASDEFKFLTLKDLVNTEVTSLAYLERTMRYLKKANLIITQQGREGGYALARSPKQIKVREILEVLEGDLHPYKCLEKECANKNCVSKRVWTILYEQIYKTLDKISLDDLINNKL